MTPEEEVQEVTALFIEAHRRYQAALQLRCELAEAQLAAMSVKVPE